MGRGIDLEEQYDRIYRYCYFKVRHRETAEDITQETFLRFMESETYQDTGKALQYLYTIARHLCVDEFRRRNQDNVSAGIRSQTGGSAPMTAPALLKTEDMAERLAVAESVKAALEGLDEGQRELLLLRYVNEVPVSVLGGMLGISRFAVYRRLREAVRALRQKLREEDVF